MELIKIIFFAIGTFFGIENSRIASEKVTVVVDPTTHTIVVQQEKLFSIIKTKNDSLEVSKELVSILKNKNTWRPEFKDYTTKICEFYTSEKGNLNATITLTYTTEENLRDFALDLNKEGNYSLIHMPRWNLQTEDGEQKGNYWNFNADTFFTFTLEPYKDIPKEYSVHKKSIHAIWEAVKE